MKPKKDYPTSVALRAFSILELIAHAPNPLDLATVTQQLGLAKPTVYRLLTRLEKAGLLIREPISKSYSVGHRLAKFALDALLNSPERGIRHRTIEGLVEEIGETCNYAVLDAHEAVYLDRVETGWPLRLHFHPGSRIPLHCTACGKLFLAHMKTPVRERLISAAPLLRYTNNTIVSIDLLETELQKIRKEEASIDNEEFLVGMICIAVPVFDQRKKVVSAISMQAPVSRVPLDSAREFVADLRKAADALASAG